MSPRTRAWIADILAGGIVGLVIGVIVAVNVVIASGVDRGYEATIADVFDHSAVVGVAVVAIAVAGPVAGVVIARRLRRRRSAAGEA